MTKLPETRRQSRDWLNEASEKGRIAQETSVAADEARAAAEAARLDLEARKLEADALQVAADRAEKASRMTAAEAAATEKKAEKQRRASEAEAAKARKLADEAAARVETVRAKREKPVKPSRAERRAVKAGAREARQIDLDERTFEQGRPRAEAIDDDGSTPTVSYLPTEVIDDLPRNGVDLFAEALAPETPSRIPTSSARNLFGGPKDVPQATGALGDASSPAVPTSPLTPKETPEGFATTEVKQAARTAKASQKNAAKKGKKAPDPKAIGKLAKGEVLLDDKPKHTFVIKGKKKAKAPEVSESLRSLSMMLEIGQTENSSLLAMAEQYDKFNLGKAYADAAAAMADGATFGQALGREEIFPRVAQEMIRAANTREGLINNLIQAAEVVEDGQDVKKEIKQALIQPGILLAAGIAFMVFAVNGLLPSIMGMFTDMDAEVPVMTTIILTAGTVLQYVFLGIAVIVILWMVSWKLWLHKNIRLRELNDKVGIRMPIIGGVLMMSATARLVGLLAASLSSGIKETDALRIAGTSCGNEAIYQHVLRHLVRQKNGTAGFAAVADTSLLPTTLKYSLASVRSSSQRIDILKRLAPAYRKESQTRLKKMTAALGPLSEMIVSSLVGLLLVMVIAPVFSLYPAMMGM